MSDFDLSILGVERNIPKVNFLEYTGIFEAPEKFGKTAFSTLYPNAILLAAEKGYMAQVINKRDINKWQDFVDFVNLLSKNREAIGDSVRTIIIDTVDELYPMAAEYVARKQGIKDGQKYETIKDIPYGQGWVMHDNEFKKQIKRILSMGFTILYLTHSTVKTIKPKDGEPYDVYKSTMPDRCANIVYAACDYIIHGTRRKIELDDGEFAMRRVLTVRGNGEAIAGNRVYFDEDIVFETEEEAMEKFQAKFREGIERNLRKAGITESIEVLEEQQKEERLEKIREYIETEKAEEYPTDVKGIIEKITEIGNGLGRDEKLQVKERFTAMFGSMAGYKKATDIEKLTEALEFIKSL
ncbi:hypothetical protein QB910_000089 [Dabrowskivirus KKP3916]|uniref:AAA domain-containing protein n=1 Tax=Alicyclobacillus phage KKP_3916 TaxID=3040651 RepID=A0AAT9V7L9_9CAUD|nr:hypothetical protein QB910_000089 [Alicyclobacillus phage KKP 3916]